MRNRYGGKCYRCNLWVKPGDGHFERYKGSWRTLHAKCCIEARRILAELNYKKKDTKKEDYEK